AAGAGTPGPGRCTGPAMGWHESTLAETRLPALAELDAAAPDHPVFARRGGHLAVANLAALRAAGIGQDTPDPAGGKFGHLPDGSLSGALEGGAVYQGAAVAPKPGHAALAEAPGAGAAAYAAPA